MSHGLQTFGFEKWSIPPRSMDNTACDPLGMTDLPKLARLADLIVVLLTAGAALVQVTGGISTRLWGVRLSATSPGKILLWAVVIFAVRHIWIRQPSLGHRVLSSGIIKSSNPFPEAPALPASWGARIAIHAAVVAFFVALTCVVMFEQVFQLRSVADLGDPLFNVWRLDWVAYQLLRDPRHLFDANIFHPEPRTLAYSDAMLVPGLVAAPWIWAGADPVVVHNVMMMASAALSGVTMFWLVRWLTGSTGAGFVAGSVFALYPLRWALYSHLELQVTVWMPLALLLFHRTIAHGRLSTGLGAGLAVALQALSCLYYGLFLSLYLCIVAASLALTSKLRFRHAAAPLLSGAVLTGLLIAPVTLPYFQNRETVGQRALDDVRPFSAHARDYLAGHPRSRVYGKLLPGQEGRLELFPGVAPLALAAPGIALLSPGTIAYTVGLAVAADASRGVNGSTYPALYRWAIPFRGLRAANRFAVLVALSLAVLAGYGVARMLRAVQSVAIRRSVAAGLVALVALESSPALELTPAWRHAPPVYASLPADQDSVLVDLPFPQRDGPFTVEYSYLYFATVHHRRLVNGGSGYYPPWYNALAVLMRDFPSDASIEALRRHGADYVVVHGAFYEPDAYARVVSAIEARPELTLATTGKWNGQEVRLYRFGSSGQ
jgi:hypothetical protein